MTRGMVLACALAAAAIAAPFAMRACADTPPAMRVDWEAGVNYTVLGRPQPTSVGPDKVEVTEAFWYGCGHCYALDPALETWKRSKAAYIEFLRLPVTWGPTHLQHARLYYTLQALGRGDLHPKVFDAIHRDGVMLAAETDEQARALQFTFLKQHGVTQKQFDAVYDSAELAGSVDRARKLNSRYEVANVPTIIVNGTYSTSVTQAGGAEQLLLLINDLAAREKHR